MCNTIACALVFLNIYLPNHRSSNTDTGGDDHANDDSDDDDNTTERMEMKINFVYLPACCS